MMFKAQDPAPSLDRVWYSPSNACHQAAPGTTPLWRLFLINLSLSPSLSLSLSPGLRLSLSLRLSGLRAVGVDFGAPYVYYCRTYEKAVSGGGEREKGGHVLRDTTSRGLYVRVWPPHTSERRGGGGGCEQEGWQGGEGRARMSGQEERQRHIRRC